MKQKWILWSAFIGVVLIAAFCLALRGDGATDSSVTLTYTGETTDGNPHGPACLSVTNYGHHEILIYDVAVETLTNSNWTLVSHDYPGELANVKAGSSGRFHMAPPGDGNWRVRIHYATEWTGLKLLQSRVREAWHQRSFVHWKGRQFGGDFELVSQEIAD